MATTDLIDQLKPWTQYSADAQRLVAQVVKAGMDKIDQRKSDFMSMCRKGPSISDTTVNWVERRGYVHKITGTLATTTITFSGSLMGAAIAASSMRNTVKNGAILERTSDGLQMVLSACDYDALTATATAWGNTGSLSDDAAAVEYRVITEKSSDDDTNHIPRGLSKTWRICGTQIFSEAFTYVFTWKNIKNNPKLALEDRLTEQITAIIYNLRNKIGSTMINGVPYYSGGYQFGNKAESPVMTGVFNGWLRIVQAESANTNIYVNKSGVAVTEDDIDSLLYNLDITEEADLENGDWRIFCDPMTRRYISQFEEERRVKTEDSRRAGQMIEKFMGNRGETLPIHQDRYMKPGTLGIINMSTCEYGYFSNDDVWSQQLGIVGRKYTKQISCQPYGVVVRKPRQIGFIYGLPTTWA